MKTLVLRSISHAGLLAVLALATWSGTTSAATRTTQDSPNGDWRFAVISDPHLYDARLGTSGSAYELYLLGDPKLVKESEAILDAALDRIAQLDVRFLLVAGDLTREGELVNHVLMARHLRQLEKRGVKVFVVPGNHDINNSRAGGYRGDGQRHAARTNPKAFRAIYHSFGYGEAIRQDPASLSYVAEPVAGLWVLGIDSCKYQESLALGTPVVGGRISDPTMAWIQGILAEARANQKEVIAFMHHGVTSHFAAEPVLFPEYLVDNWPVVSSELAQTGLKVVFTGHYHSQDAAFALDTAPSANSPLCDVETGSLAQYPCAFRVVTVRSSGWFQIHSERITEIEADTGGLPFQNYADAFLRVHMAPLVIEALKALLSFSEAEAVGYAPLAIDALVADYAGDEAPSVETLLQIQEFLASPDPRVQGLGMLLGGIWTDAPPTTDNALCIPYARGVEVDPGRPNPCGTVTPPPPGDDDFGTP